MMTTGAGDIASAVETLIDGNKKQRRHAWLMLAVFAVLVCGTIAVYLHRIEVRLAVVEAKIDTHMSTQKVAER